MLSVKCYLKAKRKENMKKHFINKNLAGFVTFYLACVLYYRYMYLKIAWHLKTYIDTKSSIDFEKLD